MVRKKHFEENPIPLPRYGEQARAIEYAGNLPVFDQFGGCGTHPLFKLLQTPPRGYCFVHSPNHSSSLPRNSIKWCALQFGLECWKKGAALKHVFKFIKTRDLKSQRFIGQSNSSFVFFPSVPFHINQFPWVIEIEDSTSLFFPFINNGSTKNIGPICREKFFPIFQELVHSKQCKGIITHMKSTAESLPVIFNSRNLSEKIFHIPLGVNLPDWVEVMKAKAEKKDEILMLFANSWHQDSANFYLRGGLDVLEAFSAIKRQCPAARLVVRSELPRDLPRKHPHQYKMIGDAGVEVLDHFLEARDWERLKMRADYFILPSARIHVVSLLEAMAYGMTLITSNGWGIEEYVKNGHNAVIVPGRDRVSWIDRETGILREDYPIILQVDHQIASEIAEAFMNLNSNRSLKQRLTLQARTDVENIYTIQNWNNKLKEVFDRITSSEGAPET